MRSSWNRNVADLNKASRGDLVREWQHVFKSPEAEKAGAKILRTCLAAQSQRQGYVAAVLILPVGPEDWLQLIVPTAL